MRLVSSHLTSNYDRGILNDLTAHFHRWDMLNSRA